MAAVWEPNHEVKVAELGVGRAGAGDAHDRLCCSTGRSGRAGRRPLGLGLKRRANEAPATLDL
jgi:hypothetical protein